MGKNELTKEVWSKESYYQKAEAGSLEFDHPAMKKLIEISNGASAVLDMGCGEGTRLNKIVTKAGQKGCGIDISTKAVGLAKEKYPRLSFLVGDLESLPYKNESFDLVYSAFVFEHLDNPKKVLKEAVRVLKKGGNLMIVAPNFGAPNRASPPFKGNRWVKLISGFIKDFYPRDGLNWHKEEPIATSQKFEIDWDTTIEPYLGSLIRFVKNLGLAIIETGSSWEEEEKEANAIQKLFRFLGERNIYPFKNWGPHLVLLAEK